MILTDGTASPLTQNTSGPATKTPAITSNVWRSPVDDAPAGPSGGDDSVIVNPLGGGGGRGFIPGGEVLSEGGPSSGSGGTNDTGNGPITINLPGRNSGGVISAAPVADAVSNLSDAIGGLQSLLSGFGFATPPKQPTGIAVPVQNENASGSSVPWMMLLVLAGVGGLGYYGYKKGWFKKVAKAVTGTTSKAAEV